MPEALESAGSKGEECFENAIESEQGLFIERYRGEIPGLDSGEIEAPGNGSGWEGVVPFDPGESLFLGCGDDFGSADKAGRAVVVKGGQAQYPRAGGIAGMRVRSGGKWAGKGHGFPTRLADGDGWAKGARLK